MEMIRRYKSGGNKEKKEPHVPREMETSRNREKSSGP